MGAGDSRSPEARAGARDSAEDVPATRSQVGNDAPDDGLPEYKQNVRDAQRGSDHMHLSSGMGGLPDSCSEPELEINEELQPSDAAVSDTRIPLRMHQAGDALKPMRSAHGRRLIEGRVEAREKLGLHTLTRQVG